MTTQLEQLKSITTVVADTGDFEAIALYQPQDATTNPSLLLKAVQIEKYRPLAIEAVKWAKDQGATDDVAAVAADKLAVLIGAKLMEQVPGYVSTEVDARLSFDTMATVEKANHLLALYRDQGIDTSRVLIKIAATWEGIQAARILEAQGIKTNVTLVFSFAQARASAEAGAFLISPFVGRILDWYKADQPDADFSGANDPGVQSVTRIYNYFKEHGYDTIVMGASFRNISEIQELAGCDRLTISPGLLDELANTDAELPRKLTPVDSPKAAPAALTEQTFRWDMNEDAMATDKLSQGIRQFAKDQVTLETMLTDLAK
ncbi:MAG: transaldolase [Alteromonadaceae bacterium]|uniref:Transaldolase n=1 Tax=Alteromonas alba TaxID=2079529 RepID=A0A2S9VDR9_9ALTE|nr:transaldolase [Alteromonas alba]MAQ01090.1 transaldolase [Alteromonadaceae bacterium]PRO74603.1 transaldolase [Alteromonas alba]|tara:strand:+ start:155 stop:1108 length:954 start_codon:yes stop_codon:yes gene_type:complete